MRLAKAGAAALGAAAVAALLATSPVQGEPVAKAAQTCEGQEATVVGNAGKDKKLKGTTATT